MVVGAPTLMLFLLSAIGATLSSEISAAREHCPPTQSANASSLVADLGHIACAHPGLGPCLSALGCVTPLAPLGSAGPSFSAVSVTVGVAALATAHRDLFRTRPPTPPPDLI